MKTITITLKSPDEVRDELRERLPQVHSSANITVSEGKTPWLWLSGTEKDAATNSVLKDIGFRWSSKRTAWYHTCEMDPTIGHYGRPSARKKDCKTKPKPAPKPKARYSPTDDNEVEAEFMRRFG
jgi:hypothetical protein